MDLKALKDKLTIKKLLKQKQKTLINTQGKREKSGWQKKEDMLKKLLILKKRINRENIKTNFRIWISKREPSKDVV
jgi:hypothetical protein